MKKIHLFGLLLCMYTMACQPVVAKSVDTPKSEISYLISDHSTAVAPYEIAVKITAFESYAYCISDHSTATQYSVSDQGAKFCQAELKREPSKNASYKATASIDQSIKRAGFILHFTNKRGEIHYPNCRNIGNSGSGTLSPPPASIKKTS